MRPYHIRANNVPTTFFHSLTCEMVAPSVMRFMFSSTLLVFACEDFYDDLSLHNVIFFSA